MYRIAMKLLFAISLLLLALPSSSQEKPVKDEPPIVRPRAEGPQLKIQVVFAEFDGEKKVKNLPYSFLVKASSADDHERDWTKIRMGSKVPLPLPTGPNTQYQYVDVGTNIDCVAKQLSDGTYRVTFNLERSWAEEDVALKVDSSNKGTVIEKADSTVHAPVIRQFRSESTVTVRDGQTLETNFATDPVTGKVIRLQVTVNSMK
jgi:hypothetical protein